MREIQIVKNSVRETLAGISPSLKLQFHAIMSVYITKNILKFPTNGNVGVYEKERNAKGDETVKIKILQKYNEKFDELPKQYHPDLELALILDLFLDLFRTKKTIIFDA